jgi:hypothetical protein
MPRAASGRARLLQISGLSQRPPQTDPALICNHEVIRGWPIPGWPDFGRTRVLNIGQGCAAVSVTRPRQQAYAQVASARDAAYGSPRPRGVPPILLTQPGVPPWRLGAGGWGQLSSIRLRRRSMSRRRCLCRSMDTSLSPPFRGWKRAEGHQVPGSGSGSPGRAWRPAWRPARPAAWPAAQSRCRSRRRGAAVGLRRARTRRCRYRGWRAARGSRPAAARAAGRRG